MTRLHNELLNRSQTYAKWHSHPAHGVTHFLALSAIGLLLTASIVSNINKNNYLDVAAASSQAAATQRAPDLTNNFLQAFKQYQKTDEAGKSAALRNLLQATLNRRVQMSEKASSNPSDFILSAMPESLVQKLPAEAQGLMEREAEIRGSLTVAIAENMETGYRKNIYRLKDKDSIKEYDLQFAQGEPDNFLTGDYVLAKGVALDNKLVLKSGSDLSQQTVSAQITAGPTGQQHVLAMLVNFSTDKLQTWTQAQVASQLFPSTNSTNAYYIENSYNKTYIDGDVTPSWITVPYDGTNCEGMYGSWASSADSQAAAMGYVLSNYNRKVYVIAGSGACSWAGLSQVGGNPSQTWVYKYNSAMLYDHELGHAVGMRHASSYACGTKSIDVASSCTLSEYGDIYDTMGYWNSFHLSSPHKAQQGYMPTANIQSVTASSGVYTIYPIESLGSNIMALKIYKPDSAEYYWVEYRQPSGFDLSLPTALVSGATIHLWSSGNTKLLDTTPGDGSFANAPLADGRAFLDGINGITITQISHNSASATVKVDYGPGVCSKAKPGVSISPVTQQGASGSTLKYSVTVTNKDTPACQATTFGVSASGLPAGFSFASSSVSINPGASATLQLSVSSPTGFADSSNIFTATAADLADASHSSSIQATYVVYTDVSVPTVSIVSPANGSSIGKAASVTISVSATDNSGISKVEIYVDNALMVTDTVTPYTYKWNTKKVSSGSHVIMAKAYDASGNAASASITVYK